MRIVIADMYYPLMHRELNIKLISCFGEFAKLTIINNKIMYDRQNFASAVKHVIDVPYYFPKKHELFRTMALLYHLFLVSQQLKKEKAEYDKIVFLTTNNIVMHLAIRLRFFDPKKVVVFHHYDIDKVISSKLGRKLFKKTMNLYQHIVFANFIKEGMISKLGTCASNISVVPHPVLGNVETIKNNNTSRKNQILGLGRANDIKFLNELISLDKQYKGELKNKIVLRTRGEEYKGANVVLFNANYIEQDEFDRLMYESKACIVIYNDSYQLRYSGIIVNHMSHGTITICNDIPIGRHFAKISPKNCYIIQNAKQLFDLAQTGFGDFDQEEYQEYLKQHDLSIIKKIIYESIHRI